MVYDRAGTNPVIVNHGTESVCDGQNCALSEFTAKDM